MKVQKSLASQDCASVLTPSWLEALQAPAFGSAFCPQCLGVKSESVWVR